MRILLAEHHSQVRRALCTLIEEKTEHVLVGEVMDRAELFEQIALTQPDLVLLDWDLPSHDGNNIITELRGLDSPPVVVVLSTQIEAKEEVLSAGADAFVSKGDPPEKLLAALEILNFTYDKQQEGEISSNQTNK
jgi:DNA-binding NarL/FixJ family response regulator